MPDSTTSAEVIELSDSDGELTTVVGDGSEELGDAAEYGNASTVPEGSHETNANAVEAVAAGRTVTSKTAVATTANEYEKAGIHEKDTGGASVTPASAVSRTLTRAAKRRAEEAQRRPASAAVSGDVLVEAVMAQDDASVNEETPAVPTVLNDCSEERHGGNDHVRRPDGTQRAKNPKPTATRTNEANGAIASEDGISNEDPIRGPDDTNWLAKVASAAERGEEGRSDAEYGAEQRRGTGQILQVTDDEIITA
ncbi:hypothetical protein PI126_g12523 [Phytophthora idaei]|nr:hypothetical protein PI126_g12523 [Phytophthora idaei]